MVKLTILFAIIVLQMLCVQSLHLKENMHDTLEGIDPASGFVVQYGCYKNKCWAYCNGLGQMWCYTNKKASDGEKSCSSDGDCNGYFYKCVSLCGL